MLMADSLMARMLPRRTWGRRAVAFLAGSLATLALPPVYATPILLLSFPLLMALAHTSRSTARAFAEGWWFGWAHYMTGLYWIAVAFVVNEDVNAAGGPVAVVWLSAVMAVYPGLVTAAYHKMKSLAEDHGRPVPPLAQVLIFAVLWSLSEYLRGHLFTGFPWNPIGSVWAFHPAAMQSAALWGVYGLGLITVVMALAPWSYISAAGRPYGSAVVAAGVLAGLAAFGFWRLGAASDAVVDGVRLRLVQANVSQNEKWQRDRLSENFIRHLDMSRAPSEPPVTHIIWPETAAPYFLNAEPSRRFLMAAVTPPGGYILAGALRLERFPDGGYELGNTLFAVDAQGAIRATYDKAHLVPFGEYMPFRNLLSAMGLERFVPGLSDFTPGPGLATVELPGLPPFSPLICYEIIFPAAVARRDSPPDWLLNITNDGWYGITSGPYQHLVTAQFRAVEEGLPAVRVAGTGISAVIDPWGRIKARLPLARAGVIDADLPRKIERRPLFARLGDWSYFIIIVIVSASAGLLCRFRSETYVTDR
jgi:apolipoprotein N-acyltransferase